MTFELIESNTYFGMNFKEYLRKINYIPTSQNKIVINFIMDKYSTDDAIKNRARYVDIVVNNCKQGYMRCSENDKYIFISSPSVNSMKPLSELSPCGEAAKICEKYLKDKINAKVFRPVSLMDVVDTEVKGLVGSKDTIIHKIMRISPGATFEIHGKGEQKRMFMTMYDACEALYEFINYPAKVLDVSEIKSDFPILIKTTVNIKIRDLVHYLSRIFGFKYLFVNDPRGVYQDSIQSRFNYPYSYYDTTRDIKYIAMCIEKMRKNLNFYY
jgi:nucleoside-diphosphate-sugar epimerase